MNPHLSVIEVMKKIGQEWASLKTGIKRFYEDKAEKDKELYQLGLLEYNKVMKDQGMIINEF